MDNDLAIRYDLFHVAMQCGTYFAIYRIVITVTYPLISGMLWQHVLGPAIEARWSGAAQCEDIRRPSYMPLKAGQPYVMSWGLLPPPIDDLTNGIRDGLLLGVLAMLAPKEITVMILMMILLIVLGKGAWRIINHCGAARTDHTFWVTKEVLFYIGALIILNMVVLRQ